MFRADFQALATMRSADARALLAAHRFDAAYYLAGFAVECALKACIAAETKRYEYPDKKRAERAWSHDLKGLLKEAGLAQAMQQASGATQTNWALVVNWNVEVRYRLGRSTAESRDFVKAVSGRGGVLPWLRQRW